MGTANVHDGLDLSRPDEITPEEIAEFHAQYERTNKGRLDSFEFWIEFRPDVLKRHKARSRHFFGAEGKARPVSIQLLAIHQYAIESFGDGIAYEIRLAQSNGARRADILDVLSVAFIHSGHAGMYAARADAAQSLRDYVDPETPDRFPANWTWEHDLLSSGMDFSSPEATDDDIAALRSWYTRTIGEVPDWVELLAVRRPGLLKAYRDRWEHAIRGSVPVQMLPYLLLNRSIVDGNRGAIRENLLLGRALGLTAGQIDDAITMAVLFAGAECLNVFDADLRALLVDSPPEDPRDRGAQR